MSTHKTAEQLKAAAVKVYADSELGKMMGGTYHIASVGGKEHVLDAASRIAAEAHGYGKEFEAARTAILNAMSGVTTPAINPSTKIGFNFNARGNGPVVG